MSRQSQEVRTYVQVLNNAIDDLGGVPDGSLCEEIASLGYGQEVAVLGVMGSHGNSENRILGARLCELYRAWSGCDKRLFTELPMNPVDPFSTTDGGAEGTLWDGEIVTPLSVVKRRVGKNHG